MCSSGIKISSKRLNCLNNQKWTKKVQSKHWQFRAEKLYEYVGNNPLSTQFLLIPHRKFSMVAVPFSPLPSPLLLYYRHLPIGMCIYPPPRRLKYICQLFPFLFCFLCPTFPRESFYLLLPSNFQLSLSAPLRCILLVVLVQFPLRFQCEQIRRKWAEKQKNDEQIRRK